jgi:hypothetical protein
MCSSKSEMSKFGGIAGDVAEKKNLQYLAAGLAAAAIYALTAWGAIDKPSTGLIHG